MVPRTASEPRPAYGCSTTTMRAEPPRERSRRRRRATRCGPARTACAARSRRAEASADDRLDLALVGESMRCVLAEHAFVSDVDIEHAALTRCERDVELARELSLQRGHQTGGLRQIVSANAVGDANVHVDANSTTRSSLLHPSTSKNEPLSRRRSTRRDLPLRFVRRSCAATRDATARKRAVGVTLRPQHGPCD